MKENDNKFSVSTIMESIKNSRRLIPFLFLVAGTFFPIAVIAFDKVLYPHLHSLLFAMLLASIFGGWIVRYIFILYDMIMGNIRFRPVIISAIIFMFLMPQIYKELMKIVITDGNFLYPESVIRIYVRTEFIFSRL